VAGVRHQDVVDELRAAGCVFAEDEARLLLEAADADVPTLLARRVAGEPLEHVVGWVAFAGDRLAVAPGVFVPRRRTELLARVAADATLDGAVVVELCCGVGAVAHVVATRRRPRRVVAVDIDPAATACARVNLPDALVLTGDLVAPLPTELRAAVDVLVANAPYVPTRAVGTMPREARDHEPHRALDGGTDGLDVARRIVDAAPDWLAPHGVLAIETSAAQAPALTGAMQTVGLTTRVVVDDDLGGVVAIGRAPRRTNRPDASLTSGTARPGPGTDTEASTT
jgi:release factor glutamine methyltransferase